MHSSLICGVSLMILRSLQDNFSKHFFMYFLLLFCDTSTLFSNLILETSRSSPKNFLQVNQLFSNYSPSPLPFFFFFPSLAFFNWISSYFDFSFFWNIVNLLLFWDFLGLIDFLDLWLFQWISGFCPVHIMNVRKIFLLSSFIFLAVSFVSDSILFSFHLFVFFLDDLLPL